MANFKLQSIFRGYKQLFGMTTEVHNKTMICSTPLISTTHTNMSHSA